MAGRGLSCEQQLYRPCPGAATDRKWRARVRAAALRYSAELLRKTAEHNTQDAALLLEQLADEQE